MLLENGTARLVKVELRSGDEAEVRVTLAFTTTLLDTSPTGHLVEAWEILRTMLEADEAVKLEQAAAPTLGDDQHIVRVWGLPADKRHEDSSPLLSCSAARLVGKAVAQIKAPENDITTADVRLMLEARAVCWSPVLLQDIASQVKGQCWVDVLPKQTDIEDGVEPAIRKPADAAQGGLALVDGEG